MKRAFLISLVTVLSLAGCDSWLLPEEEPAISLEQNLAAPTVQGDGLAVSSPEDELIDRAGIETLITNLHNSPVSNGVRSLLIARNNKLVVEAYFNGWNGDRKQDLRSATKSFTSSLIGIAIDRQLLPGEHAPLLDYLGGCEAFENCDETKRQITLEDFLRMRTGLACNDWAGSSPGNENKMYKTDDWVKFIMDLPMVNEPGEVFSYCTGAPVTLGAVLANVSEQSVADFASENLFAPLGIADYSWEYLPNGQADTGGHLHLRPRDMLRFGLLFLNGGSWNGRQLVSEEWVQKSTEITGQAGNQGYGYLWWGASWSLPGGTVSSFYASGNGGQLIFVLPSLNAVVVMTGGQYGEDWLPSRLRMMENLVLPAFQ